MKKLILTFFIIILTLAGTCFAEAAAFEGQGVKFNLPEGFQQKAPRLGYVMEAVTTQDISEMNLSTAPDDDFAPTEADLQRGADYYFESYGRRGTTMKAKAVVDVGGGHRGISLIGEKTLGQQKIECQWLIVVMHNKRYILLYNYLPAHAAAVAESVRSFSCTAH